MPEIPFKQVRPGGQFWYQGKRYVRIDPNCDFARDLPKPAVIDLETGEISWFGRDNCVEPIQTLLKQ